MLGKVYQPVLMQSSYKSELHNSCKEIKLRASRIKNEANICMQRRMVDMNQTLHIQQDVLLDTNETSARSLSILENLYYRLLLSTEARFLQGAGGCGEFHTPTMQPAIKGLEPVEAMREGKWSASYGLPVASGQQQHD